MSRTTVFRTLIAGGSALAMVIAISPLAIAADGNQGKSGSHGNKSGISVPAFPGGFKGEKGLENKNTKLENAGKALEAQARALAKKQMGKKKGSLNPAIAAAQATYKAVVTSAQQSLNAALQAANLAFQQALAAVHTVVPTPSASPSATPSPTATQ